ncbi:uncharacterized protein DSM5745_06769 [Aspergillus mulundensis]|uniref:Uncharacterized protein n=1 Tax=Aspergillus mulundensis TaxID=1810919 RepID=A0A3D8RRR2_9EURO|nr:hypothetical protein DSM5745_06769 [Aspergillus mulundensis]RDW76777.1 hypothetical protein DSM5745_06769 [Aspergillus mulundensis]
MSDIARTTIVRYAATPLASPKPKLAFSTTALTAVAEGHVRFDPDLVESAHPTRLKSPPAPPTAAEMAMAMAAIPTPSLTPVSHVRFASDVVDNVHPKRYVSPVLDSPPTPLKRHRDDGTYIDRGHTYNNSKDNDDKNTYSNDEDNDDINVNDKINIKLDLTLKDKMKKLLHKK